MVSVGVVLRTKHPQILRMVVAVVPPRSDVINGEKMSTAADFVSARIQVLAALIALKDEPTNGSRYGWLASESGW